MQFLAKGLNFNFFFKVDLDLDLNPKFSFGIKIQSGFWELPDWIESFLKPVENLGFVLDFPIQIYSKDFGWISNPTLVDFGKVWLDYSMIILFH